jgi:hypothetical protein
MSRLKSDGSKFGKTKLELTTKVNNKKVPIRK